MTVSFGQRRPLRPATPLQLQDGQQLQNVSFSLPRGSVITGHIMDEDGEMLARAAVTVLRYQYQGGERRRVVAGSDETDDRGQYRVFGLPPDDYYVSAVSRLWNRPIERLVQFVAGQAPAQGGEREDEPLGYAPTYYPGVTSAAEAARVTVGLGQEAGSVDFQLQLVPMARLSGYASNPDGSPLAGGVVIVVPDESGAAARGASITGRVGADGAFVVTGIPAGRRAIRAPNPPSPWALKAVIVDGRDVTDTPLEVRHGQKITEVQVVFTDRVTELAGAVRDEKGAPAVGYTVVAFSTDSSTWRAQSRTIQAVQPDQTGAFFFRGLPPGSYFLVALDDVEQGEWFDPLFLEEAQKSALRVTLSEGTSTTQDVRVKGED